MYLVLSAITASMMGANKSHRRPIALGAGIGFLAQLTWFIAVGIISDLTTAFQLLMSKRQQELLAIIVLLTVMNWFFHKVYWTGWISMHNRKKRDLLHHVDDPNTSANVYFGDWHCLDVLRSMGRGLK